MWFKEQIEIDMFELIKQVDNLDILNSSTAFSYESISKKCNIGKDVWIKYYNSETDNEGQFTVSDSATPIGGVPTVMLYVENEDCTYNVYRYKGELVIDRRIIRNIRQDILSNIDDIISDLKEFIK